MSDLRALLAAATPDWTVAWSGNQVLVGGTKLPTEADAELAVAAVNALPALLDVVEAARDARKAWRLVNSVEYHGDEDELLANGETLDDPMDRLRDALARLDEATR